MLILMKRKKMIKLLTVFFLFINCSFIYAEKGSFSMNGAGLANIDVIKQGNNTFIIADVKNSTVVYDATGNLFKNGDIIMTSGVGLVKQINNSSNLEFYSVAVKDGDSKSRLFMRFERKVGDLSSGSGGDGKAFITGGTGVYANISGKCSYSVKYYEKGAQTVKMSCNYSN